MGNLIEFRTWPKHRRLFYEITSGAISFWLKSHGSAVVGLTTGPDMECYYEITIESDKCSLKSDKQFCSKITDVDNILSGTEFRKFWILWKNNTFVFGSGRTILLRWRWYCIKNPIKYVTFCSNSDSGMAEWKFYLPHTIESLPLKKFHGGEPHWVQVVNNNKLPDGALIGGFENEFLYIMRAPFRGSLTPGKFVPSFGLGFIAWGPNSHGCETVEILCGCNCIWVPSKDHKVPTGAVEGGYSEVDHEVLYVGRVHYKGHLIVGKVQPSHKCCYFAYEDKTRSEKIFEVLVVPNSKMTVSVLAFNSDEVNEDMLDDDEEYAENMFDQVHDWDP